jgi:hypothetical protein
MSHSSTHTPRFGLLRRLWKPAAATGAGGTAVAIWFDEIISVSQEILALILLPIIAGAIYLLDIFIFKSHMPSREDMKNIKDKGANKG